MIWLKIVGKILKALKDGATPPQLALGFVLGWAIGMLPGWPVQVWALVVLLLVLQANLSMAIAGALIASALAWIFDPWLEAVGEDILRAPLLRDVFTYLYNSPPWALTRFNNTVMMGSMAGAVLSVLVLFPLMIKFVHWYREVLMARITRFRVVQIILGSRIVAFYRRLESMGLV